jgi:hypothetical protein
MRFWIPVAALVLLSACSDAPVAKAPEKPLEPLTGRQAFYATYPQARAWAIDSVPVRVRSVELNELKAIGAKAAAWEVMYASPAKGRSRIYTWSAVEAAGNLHKGVFASHEESWQPGGSDKTFVVQALKVDTPEALETAIAHSDTYFKGGGVKPHPKFDLENTARFPDPVWRIYWGDSVSTAEWSVFIDATTGAYSGR